MEKCLFCDSDKEGGKVESGKDFICSSCVAMLMSYPQEALQKTYQKCLRMKFDRKASALETFLEEVRHDGSTSNERGVGIGRGVDDGGRAVESVRMPIGNRETSSGRG